jgi:hypothetical protein
MDANEPKTTLRKKSPLPWILIALAAAAGGAYLWLRLRAEPPPPPAALETPAPAPPPEELEPTPEAAAAGEATLADLLPKVSSDALARRGLSPEDFVRRAAVVIANLAEGVSPRRELAFLEPKGRFQAVRRGGKLVMAPASYARYDAFAAAVRSVDVAALGAAWRAGRPALQAAYRRLGYRGTALDRALARALRRLAEAPVRDGEVELVEAEGVHVYADQALEKLPAVEKHLLRMGPANTRVIQEKAREILAELKLPEK